jgi:dCMP deaminase
LSDADDAVARLEEEGPDDTVLSAPDARPSWDAYFMEIASVVAKRSTCQRRLVGAVLVSGRRLLATGYNGPPKGLRHCAECGGCYRAALGIPSGERQELCRAVHAEQNAILQASVYGVALQGDVTLYCTIQPCVTCAKMLINANVRRIVFLGDYPDDFALQLFREAGVDLVRWQPTAASASEPQ